MSEQSQLSMLAKLGNLPFLAVIYLYRVTLSPFIGGQCRFEPTCSRYGIEAYKVYGPIRGTVMTGKRILRCHPFSKGGYDPVPIRSCRHQEHATDGSNESEQDQ